MAILLLFSANLPSCMTKQRINIIKYYQSFDFSGSKKTALLAKNDRNPLSDTFLLVDILFFSRISLSQPYRYRISKQTSSIGSYQIEIISVRWINRVTKCVGEGGIWGSPPLNPCPPSCKSALLPIR